MRSLANYPGLARLRLTEDDLPALAVQGAVYQESEATANGSAPNGAFLDRADQWHEKALRHPDHQQACIGAVNAGVARILNAVETAIKRGIENCTTTVLEEPSIQHAITAHTGLLRQWQSMMSLQARLEKMRLDAEKLEAERQLDPLLRKAR